MEFKHREVVPFFPNFKECIIHLMQNYLKLGPEYVKRWTTPECMKKFEMAFTAPSYDDDKEEKDKINSKEYNYEFYEIVGDACFNKNILYYIQDRFPQFRNPDGVKFITKIKLRAVSKETYHVIAEPLGIYPWIRASKVQKETNKNKLLEDVLESFVGCFELMVNEDFYQIGCPAVYTMVKTMLDKMYIPTTLEELTDPISRLKEIFDELKKHGYTYREAKEQKPLGEITGTKADRYRHVVNIYITVPGKPEELFGTGEAFISKEAQKIASVNTEKKLKSCCNITYVNTVVEKKKKKV